MANKSLKEKIFMTLFFQHWIKVFIALALLIIAIGSLPPSDEEDAPETNIEKTDG